MHFPQLEKQTWTGSISRPDGVGKRLGYWRKWRAPSLLQAATTMHKPAQTAAMVL